MPEKLNILVFDGNENYCQNIADILELRDYEVMTAYDGCKGIDLVRQNDFDLVLMDIRMPVMDDVQTFKKVKEIAPDTPVIMITAFAVEDLIREALPEGAFGVLQKPVDFDNLLEVIERATPDGKLILVADDENLCTNMTDVLSDKGYRVSVSCDGETAIEQAESSNSDVILIDMQLPPLNALETYLAIRDFRPDVVAIIISGCRPGRQKLAQQVLNRNAYTCLEKPFNLDELLSLLERIQEQKDKGLLTSLKSA